MTRTIYLCSSNKGKLREFALAAKETPFTAEILPCLAGISPPEETGTTFKENSRLKAMYYAAFTGELVLADDSGLAVDALGGAPGVYSARYAGAGASDNENNRLLLKKMEGVSNRSARFVCAVTVAQQGAVIADATGTVEGSILHQATGADGFGYDPVFFYPPFAKSFGEVGDEKKLEVSARGKALRAVFRTLLGSA